MFRDPGRSEPEKGRIREVTLVFDLSRSKGKVSQYLKMDYVEGYKVPSRENIEAFLEQARSILLSVEGITFAQTRSDWSGFVFTLSARFSRIQSLNAAIIRLGHELGKLDFPASAEENFQLGDHSFRRIFHFDPDPESFRQLPSMQRYMLETAYLISIYRFERPIDHFTHVRAVLSPSGKAIMLKMPLSELATGNGTLSNTITFGN